MEPLINPPQLPTSESHIPKEKKSLGIFATQITNDPTHLKHNFTRTFDAWAFREIQHLEPRPLTQTARVTLAHRSAVSELPALGEPKGADVSEPLQREEVLEGRPGEVQLRKRDVLRHQHLQRLESRGGQLELEGARLSLRVRQCLAEVCTSDPEHIVIAALSEGRLRALLPELRSGTCGA